ncbi:MAG: terpene cyclase/mutase family protein [Kiritimatiellae bacterium]|nr:terpene cyclase/mutase family protein [Kiritimatiellia bacterium]
MKNSPLLLTAVVAGLVSGVRAQGFSPVLESEVKASVNKGLQWLKAQQKPAGMWSDEHMPAMTALPLWAFVASGEKAYASEVDRAVAFLLGKQQTDGGIYVPVPGRQGGWLGNYNTSICVAALYATGRREVMPAVLKARSYIAASQHVGDDPHAGGFGYDKDAGRRYSDLNNTHFSMDAMRRTQGAEDLRPAGEKRADINWDSALKYVTQMQNTEGETAGGFAYNTQDPKGGVTTNASGRVMLRAYGSMTYAGLLALVHARLGKSDPRVRSAVEYGSRFWTLEENPGQGQQGLFFYYNAMSRALSAAGLDALPKHASDGTIRWREEMVRKIISLQKPDGSWVNENNRWWENDPVLATSYSLLALEFASGLAR